MTSANNAYVGGALDLSQVKARAEARQQAQEQSAAGQASRVQPFFTVTEANFDSEVLRRSTEVPVIVLIGTARSTQSEQLKHDLQELAVAGNLNFLVGYVDAEATPQVAQAFGVKNLPTVVAIAAGQPLTNFEGAQPKEALQRWLDSLVEQVGPQLKGLESTPAAAHEEEEDDPRLQEAESFLNAGDFDGAITIYESILESDRDNTQIKRARDTAVILKRLDLANQTEDPIVAADGDKGDIDKQMRAADAEVVAGAPEKAFNRLIETMQFTAGDEKAQLRARLLEFFGLFASNDPRVLKARTMLANALY